METSRKNWLLYILFCATAIALIMGSYVEGMNKGLEEGRQKALQETYEFINIMEQRIAVLKQHQETTSELIDALERRVDASYSMGSVSLSYGDKFNAATFNITAYSPYDDRNGLNSQGDPSVTATGTTPRPGTFAVDPDVIPYGSKMIIIYPDGTVEEGYAEDTGSAIAGKRGEKRYNVDVFRHTFDEAISFGSQRAVVIWYKGDEQNED